MSRTCEKCGDRLKKCRSCAPRTHGHTMQGFRTRTYRAWDNMLQRCRGRSRWDFHLYGGRGIKVCFRWRGRGGFGRFLADVGTAPPGLELDRVNVDGNYTKGNVRWVTRGEQNANRRNLSKARRAA